MISEILHIGKNPSKAKRWQTSLEVLGESQPQENLAIFTLI